MEQRASTHSNNLILKSNLKERKRRTRGVADGWNQDQSKQNRSAVLQFFQPAAPSGGEVTAAAVLRLIETQSA